MNHQRGPPKWGHVGTSSTAVIEALGCLGARIFQSHIWTGYIGGISDGVFFTSPHTGPVMSTLYARLFTTAPFLELPHSQIPDRNFPGHIRPSRDHRTMSMTSNPPPLYWHPRDTAARCD